MNPISSSLHMPLRPAGAAAQKGVNGSDRAVQDHCEIGSVESTARGGADTQIPVGWHQAQVPTLEVRTLLQSPPPVIQRAEAREAGIAADPEIQHGPLAGTLAMFEAPPQTPLTYQVLEGAPLIPYVPSGLTLAEIKEILAATAR